MESKSNTREIKYRLIQNGKIEGYERLKNGEWEWMWIELNPDKGERWCSGVVEKTTNPIIRNQFTGLKDSKGVDIFEGDIITCSIIERENYDDDNSGKPLTVSWDNECAGFYPFTKASQWRSEVYDATVIGNIYQTPNL